MVAFLCVLFGGSHIGLAALRGRLVARLGEPGFAALFSVIAAVTFAALVMYYADHRFDGAPGLALADSAALRWPLIGLAMVGLALTVPGLVSYPRLPSALFAQPIRTARGIEKISRHPFFAGIGLFALAHALLATRLVGTVFFGGLLLLVVVGTWHQDRKLLARRGAAYAGYLASTSAVPFAAILSGRQRLTWRDLPAGALAGGLVLALALRQWHDVLFADRGAWIIGVVLLGALIAGVNALRRARRHAHAAPIGAAAAREQ
jgi:uncharacterized membrane protein